MDYESMIDNIIPGFTSYNPEEELYELLKTVYASPEDAKIALVDFQDKANAFGYRGKYKNLIPNGNRIVQAN